ALAGWGNTQVRVDARLPYGDGATERRNVDTIDVVPAALLNDRIDALGVGAPRVRTDREGPPCRRLHRPTVRPADQHQPQPIRLEPRALHREVREPFPVGRVARRVVGA